MNISEELSRLYKNDPELAEVLDVVEQIRQVYADIREVRGLNNKYSPPIAKNSADVQILYRSNSSAE